MSQKQKYNNKSFNNIYLSNNFLSPKERVLSVHYTMFTHKPQCNKIYRK